MANSVVGQGSRTGIESSGGEPVLRQRKGLWAYSPVDDRLHDECGVFGVLGHPDAARLTALGLHALQHRGQESAGIVSYDGKLFHSERHLGLVGDRFNKPGVMDRLRGQVAIGHVRYSTTGDTILRNVHPLFANIGDDGFAVGHNGNLTNAMTLRDELVGTGAIFQSTTDSEVLVHLLARSKKRRMVERLVEALLRSRVLMHSSA